jgi:hypothetical protein
MIALWLGLLCLSGTWLFLEPMFVPRPDWVAAGCSAATGLGLIFLSAGRKWRRSLGLTALVLGAQFLGVQLLWPILAAHHQLPMVTPLLLGLSRWFGLPTAMEQRVLFFQTEEDVLPFVTNWEKLGLLLPVCLALAMAVVQARGHRRWQNTAWRWAGGLVLLLAYVLVRYLVLCGWLIEFGDAKAASDEERLGWFTSSWIMLLTYFPFALIAARMRLSPSADNWPEVNIPRLRPLAVLSVGVALIFLAFHVVLPGTTKAGRVIVDDRHSGFWEPSLPRFNTDGFGAPSLYNCSSLLDYLGCFFHVRVNVDRALDPALLADCDVLVLKTPTHRYSAAEIAAVLAFVKRGGGLLLIGDHTNLLGMSSFLNEIAAQLGIEFCYDASNAYSSGFFSNYEPPWLFAHPIVQGLERVNFLTTCTLKHGLSVKPVMIGHDLLADPIDYSKPSFFGKLKPSPRNGFGLFPLAVAGRAERGRVVAFADSTTMSNFAAFLDDTATYYLRVVQYLNQTNADDGWLKGTLGAAGLLLIGLGFAWLARGGPATGCTGLVVAGLTGYLVAGVSLRFLNSLACSPPHPSRPTPRVAYLTGPHLRYDIPPAIGPSWVPLDQAFDSLFVVPQRFGKFPLLAPVDKLDPSRFSFGVAINPADDMPAGEVAQLTRFIRAGGSLLVFQEPACTGTVAQKLTTAPGATRLFEHELTLPPLVSNTLSLTLPSSLGPTNAAWPTNAGILLTQTRSNSVAIPARLPYEMVTNKVTYSAWKVDAGKLYLVSNSALFSRWWLGNVMAEPNAAQRSAYNSLFAVFREFFGDVDQSKQSANR